MIQNTPLGSAGRHGVFTSVVIEVVLRVLEHNQVVLGPELAAGAIELIAAGCGGVAAGIGYLWRRFVAR